MSGKNRDGRAYQVDLEPVGRRVAVPAGATLLDAAQAAGVELAAVCGGVGLCGKCRVRLMTGKLSAPGEAECELLSEARPGAEHRLACQCYPVSDVKVEIPPESLMSAQRLQIEGLEEKVELDPVIVTGQVRLAPPDLGDLQADASRLQAGLADLGISADTIGLPILVELSNQLRFQGWEAVVAVRGGEVVGVLPNGAQPLGLAVDIGTTKMAAYLVDFETGNTLTKGGVTNPQVPYGEDVLSRIAYANEHRDGRKVLQFVVVDRLNELVIERT